MNPITSLASPDLDLRYQHSKGIKPSISARSSDFTPFKHSECGEYVFQTASSHDSPFFYGGFGYLLQSRRYLDAHVGTTDGSWLCQYFGRAGSSILPYASATDCHLRFLDVYSITESLYIDGDMRQI